MIQSWSSSYSYSNDGKNEQVSYENKYKDNKNQYSTGMRRKKDRKTHEKDELFYQTKQDDNKRRDILGKSKNNSSWEIDKRSNGLTKMKERVGYNKYGSYFNYLDQIGKPQLVQHKPVHQIMNAGSQNMNIGNKLSNLGIYNNIRPKTANGRRRPLNNVMYCQEGFQNKMDQMFNDPFFKN
jgi:hypothetical protein